MSDSRFTRIPAPKVPGIADSVKVTAGDFVFVSGAVGFEADGSVPTDFARATELTLRELERALRDAGADFSSLVRVNIYITGLNQEKLGIYRRVRDEIFGTDTLIASSLIGVEALFNNSTIEIDAIAAV